MLALVCDGDWITIDAQKNLIELEVDDAEIDKRMEDWKRPPLKVGRGVLYRYANSVSSASEGCIADK